MMFVWPFGGYFVSLHHESGGPPQISIPWLPRAVPSLQVIVHIDVHSLKSRNIPWGRRAVSENSRWKSEDLKGGAGREGVREGGMEGGKEGGKEGGREATTDHIFRGHTRHTIHRVRRAPVRRPSDPSHRSKVTHKSFPSDTPWTVPTRQHWCEDRQQFPAPKRKSHDRESGLMPEGWHREGMCGRKSLLDVVEEWGIPELDDDRETKRHLWREQRSHILFTHRPHDSARLISLKLGESESRTALAASSSLILHSRPFPISRISSEDLGHNHT
jgi:hypothetical protein